MRTRFYAVYRCGSNLANQDGCNKEIVGTIEATSREEACRFMSNKVTVYHNQHLEAVPLSRLSKAEQCIAAKRGAELEAALEVWEEVVRDAEKALLRTKPPFPHHPSQSTDRERRLALRRYFRSENPSSKI